MRNMYTVSDYTGFSWARKRKKSSVVRFDSHISLSSLSIDCPNTFDCRHTNRSLACSLVLLSMNRTRVDLS